MFKLSSHSYLSLLRNTSIITSSEAGSFWIISSELLMDIESNKNSLVP